MASTFKRRSASKTSSKSSSSPSFHVLSGTKPWTGGITLTSSGLRDLDQILGAGQPLGTCIWLEEDRWTRNLALVLVKYWCAEALSQQQTLLIPCVENKEHELYDETTPTSSPWEEDEKDSLPSSLPSNTREQVLGLLNSLPRNLHMDKASQKQQQQSSDTLDSSLNLGTLEEEEEDEREEESKQEEEEEELKIAWQYRKSVQRERLGHVSSQPTARGPKGKSTNEFCHSYDLQGRLLEQVNVLEECHIFECSDCQCKQGCHTSSCGIQWYQSIRAKLQSLVTQEPPKVIRLLFHGTRPSTLAVALPLLLSCVREHEWPVVVMISSRPWEYRHETTSLNSLRRLSDVVLETEGFASRREYPPPSEFRMFQGLLKVPKVSTLTAATANGGGGHFADLTSGRPPAADLYGLKRDRRKLHIQMLHIPPEEYVEGGGSVSSGAVRSGAGRPKEGGLACASSGGALDF